MLKKSCVRLFSQFSEIGVDMYEHKGYTFTIEAYDQKNYRGFIAVMNKCHDASFALLEETKKLARQNAERAIDYLIEYKNLQKKNK